MTKSSATRSGRDRGTALSQLLPAGAALAVLLAGPSHAATEQSADDEPAAIIEAIDAASVTDLGFMDFVYEGREIFLADHESLTISYLRSCRVEEITGGSIKVGRSQSEVSSPTPVVVSAVDCDGGGIVPTERQGEDVAALTFRRVKSDEKPPVRTNSTAPLFAFSEPVEELLIERADPFGQESYRLSVEGQRLDLADQEVTLEAGAVYRATAGERSVLIKVAKKASRHGRTLIERLIAF